MEVIFYYNLSDDRVINKNIITPTPLDGVVRDDVSIMNPVIRFENDDVIRFNYAYIPEFERYYSITDKTCYRQGIWDVSFAVDVLMSFRNDIMSLTVVADKQSMDENGDEYIDDGSLVTDNLMFSRVVNFPVGFNEDPEYILIVAG